MSLNLKPHIPIHIPVKPWQRIRLLRRHRDRESSNELQLQWGNHTALRLQGKQKSPPIKHISPVSPHITVSNRTNRQSIDLPLEQTLLKTLWSKRDIFHLSLVFSSTTAQPHLNANEGRLTTDRLCLPVALYVRHAGTACTDSTSLFPALLHQHVGGAWVATRWMDGYRGNKEYMWNNYFYEFEFCSHNACK